MCNARPCKCSCDLVPVENSYEAVMRGPVGAFSIGLLNLDGRHYAHLRVKLPNEGGQYHSLPLYLKGEPKPTSCAAWKWDGNRSKPTLDPSIRTRLLKHSVDHDGPYQDGDMEESWHGHIIAGHAKGGS